MNPRSRLPFLPFYDLLSLDQKKPISRRFPNTTGDAKGKKNVRLLTLGVTVLLAIASPALAFSEPTTRQKQPRLIVQITVDQLRGDRIGRWAPQIKKLRKGGGFDFLLSNGIHYTDAHYQHAVTETAVGHATIFTGANPSGHGIVSNQWFDIKTGRKVYNCENDSYRVLGKQSLLAKRIATIRPGVAPTLLTSNTFGDQLIAASGGLSRVFAVSIKDRGAILPAGFGGKAFWFSKSIGGFASSTYYYSQLPHWVTRYNSSRPTERYRSQHWRLLDPIESYEAKDRDDRSYENPGMPHLGKTFPHPYHHPSDGLFNDGLKMTPACDELVIEFALLLAKEYALGQGQSPDLLALSLSAMDYIGHSYGPASLEAEDNFRQLDISLSRLIAGLAQMLPIENIAFALSSDHGIAEAPEYMLSLGLPAKRINKDQPLNQLQDALRTLFGQQDNLIQAYSSPYLYLDMAKIKAAKISPQEVEDRCAELAMKYLPNLHSSFTRKQIIAKQVPSSLMGIRILNSFHPTRSGHVHLVFKPYTIFVSENTNKRLLATHGSPWNYDTHVPIIFSRSGWKTQQISRRVGPEDIAATWCNWLHLTPPSASVGKALQEVIRTQP